MKDISRYTVIGALVMSLTACSGMTTRDRDTAIGAGVGAAGGALLSNGSGVGTVGGAVVGGVIGNQVGRHDEDRDRYDRRGDPYDRH